MSNSADYKICSNCIMDTSDSSIRFDSDGVCEYCNNFCLYLLFYVQLVYDLYNLIQFTEQLF